jgi:hypothetical protein
VAFHQNGVLLATDATSPYSWSVPGAAAGAYTFTAVAMDNRGASTTSAPVSVTVVVPVPPTGALSAALSVNRASVESGGAVTVSWSTANATQVTIDPLGTVAATGSRIVNPTQTTVYTLSARSATGESIIRSATVTVIAANVKPTSVLTSPTAGRTLIAPATINLTASATDPDGTVVNVAFYRNGALLSTDSTGPYSWTVTGAAAGTYTFTAVATDNRGASTISASVSVVVSARLPERAPPTPPRNLRIVVR